MAEFSGLDDNGRMVEFYDADEDGTLARLGRENDWEGRDEMLRRIDLLDLAANTRPATREDVLLRLSDELGTRVSLVIDGRIHSGIVKSIQLNEVDGKATYELICGNQNGPSVVTRTVEVDDFYEVEQLEN